MVLKFYQDLLSQPCRAIQMFLKANNIPFEDHPIDLLAGENKTCEFAKINKKQQVPAIDNNGFLLPESLAIIRYLIRENEVPDHWYPSNSEARARVDQYLSWHTMAVRYSAGQYFLYKSLLPRLTKEPVKEDLVKERAEQLEKALDDIENIYLDGNDFLCGNEISIADLFAISELEQPIAIGHNISENRQKLTDWMERVKAKMEPHYSQALERLENFAKQ